MAIWTKHHGADRYKSQKPRMKSKKDTDEEGAHNAEVHLIGAVKDEKVSRKLYLQMFKKINAGWVKARQKFEAAWNGVEGSTPYVSYLTYTAFLTSSILFSVGHALALVFPKDKLGDLKRQILLAAMAALIVSYFFAIILSSSPSLCFKRNKGEEYGKLAKTEYVTSMFETISSLALACVATKLIVENTREPIYLLFGYCVCSLFSISSSLAAVFKVLKLPPEKLPDNHRTRLAMRFLSIILSTTNICLCVTSMMGSKILAPDYLRSSIKLAVNIGWIVVFSGALMLLRAGQLKFDSSEKAFSPHTKGGEGTLIKDMQCSQALDVSLGGLAIHEHVVT